MRTQAKRDKTNVFYLKTLVSTIYVHIYMYIYIYIKIHATSNSTKTLSDTSNDFNFCLKLSTNILQKDSLDQRIFE